METEELAVKIAFLLSFSSFPTVFGRSVYLEATWQTTVLINASTSTNYNVAHYILDVYILLVWLL